MRKNWMNYLLAVGGFCAVTAFAVACPDEKAHAEKDAKSVAKAEDPAAGAATTCDGKGATVTADKAKSESKDGACCAHGQAAAASATKSGCCSKSKTSAVLASMPHMQYRVGSETVECPHAAGQMAKKNGGKVEYLAGTEAFATKGEALAKLASMLETTAKDMTTVTYVVGEEGVHCPMTAKKIAAEKKAQIAYRVGGVDFDSQEKADKTAQLVKDAASAVKVSYKVGEESFCCDKMAGARAKETGKTITYIVGEETCADVDEMKVKVAEIKIRTIVETAAGQLGS